MKVKNGAAVNAALGLADVFYGKGHIARRMKCPVCLHEFIAGFKHETQRLECGKCGYMVPSAWGSENLFPEDD